VGRRPSRAGSGGSIVFSVATWAGPARSIGNALTNGSSSRTHASTSGSSGIDGGTERRLALRLGRQVRDQTYGRECDGHEGEAGNYRASPQRGAETQLGREDAACKGAERNGAPDEEAPGGGHPPEKSLGCQGLHQAATGDVEGRAARGGDEQGDDEKRK